MPPKRAKAICPICLKSMTKGSTMCEFCRWVAQQKAAEVRSKKPGAGRRAGQKAWHERNRNAPGLTYRQHKSLLRRWKKQGRNCMYCGAKCQTIDHVLPLILGGTNYEGNLAPACCQCNMSKSDDLVIVWRSKRGNLSGSVARQQLSNS